MQERPRKHRWGLGVLCLSAALLPEGIAEVNLEWRPATQTAVAGDDVDIALFAVSDDDSDPSMRLLTVIMEWDATRLELLGIVREHDDYDWERSLFWDDRDLDRVNNDCGEDEFCDPYTGLPYNDGDAYYEARAFTPNNPAPEATPDGLLVTTFRFKALRPGTGSLQFISSLSAFTATRVLRTFSLEDDVIGTLGPAAEVTITPCALPPTVVAEGARYLAVTPPPGENPIALRVSGDKLDDRIFCVSAYVQADGRLGSEPVFQTPTAWGLLHVTGEQIIPNASYQVQTECGKELDLKPSDAATATTWHWGDVDGSGAADEEDVLLVLAASEGVFEFVTRFNVDQAGCEPDGVIDADDILFVLAATQDASFPCPAVCATPVDLDDFFESFGCLLGPTEEADPECDFHDMDGDNDVDLKDFSTFENLFLSSPSTP